MIKYVLFSTIQIIFNISTHPRGLAWLLNIFAINGDLAENCQLVLRCDGVGLGILSQQTKQK